MPLGIPNKTRYLYLGFNEINDIPFEFMEQFGHLTELDISHNKVESPFRLPANIMTFLFHNNKLEKVDEFFKNKCNKLRLINLTGNPIKVIGDGSFKNCSNIVKLVLGQTNITHITNHTFDGLTVIEKLELRSNPLRHIEVGAFTDVCRSVVFIIIADSPGLLNLPTGLFKGCYSLQELVLRSNGFTHIAGETFTGLRNLLVLSMSFNFHLQNLSNNMLSGIHEIFTMSLIINDISEIPAKLFHNVTLRTQVNFGYNRLKTLPAHLFHKDNTIASLLLQHNQILSIPDKFFHNLTHLREIFLFGNKLIHITSHMFLKTNLQRVYLFRNNISIIEGYPFTTGVNATIRSIDIRDNPINSISWEAISNLLPGATVILNCENVMLPTRINNLNIKCVSTRSTVFITVPFKSEPRHALQFGGFECKGITSKWLEVNCTSCPSGTFGNKMDRECLPCPAGGFYQDKVGTVSDEVGDISCHICNPGTYVPLGRGNSSKSCKVCPEGTNKTRHAGFRACFCLDNYYRKNRFGKCIICPQDGANCSGDIVQLRQGYYWYWNSSNKLYEKFKRNLQIFNDSYDRETSSFNASLPMIYKCPLKENCINNVSEVKGNCRKGYHGWMCTVCEHGYIKLVGFCKECSSLWMIFIDMTIFLASLITYLVTYYFYKNKRSLPDEIISRWKITLGFYQVASTYWLQHNSVSSLDPMFQIFVFRFMRAFSLSFTEIFRIPSCFFQWYAWNVHSELKLAYIVYVLCFTVLMLTYIMTEVFRAKLPNVLKQRTYARGFCIRACVVILFITYSETCYTIFQLFYCDSFFLDENEVDSIRLLHSDYSINCNSTSHIFHMLLSVPLLVFVICFPVVLLIVLKNYYKLQPSSGYLTSHSPWVTFLCGNYTLECWYWEIVELARKAVLIAFPMLFGWSGVSKITALSFSTFFIIVYIEKKPMRSKRQARLQLTSLFLVHLNIIAAPVMVSKHTGDVTGDVIFLLTSVLNTGFVLLVAGTTIIESNTMLSPPINQK